MSSQDHGPRGIRSRAAFGNVWAIAGPSRIPSGVWSDRLDEPDPITPST